MSNLPGLGSCANGFVVAIEATKEGIKFSCAGDIGSGAVTLRQNTNVDKPELGTTIELQEPVALTFSLKYLVNFCKASGLSSTVTLSLSNEIPLLIEYTRPHISHSGGLLLTLAQVQDGGRFRQILPCSEDWRRRVNIQLYLGWEAHGLSYFCN